MTLVRARLLGSWLAVLLAMLPGCATPWIRESLGPELARFDSEEAEEPQPHVADTPSHEATEQSVEASPAFAQQPQTQSGQHTYPINLPTALQLAEADNLQVAFAREQMRQAYARVERADVLWLPSLRGGVNYNRHEGAIQDVAGSQFDASRGAFYTGLGAGTFGAGSPLVPGLYMNFHLTDAIFQPLAARQLARSRQRLAAAAQNDIALRVSLAYVDLVRASEETAIALHVQELTENLAKITGDFAASGQGLQADADRMQAEVALRRNDVARAEENTKVAAARLAQLLRLDPTLPLQPAELATVAVEMVDAQIPLPELVAQGLSARPELAAHRHLVGEAVQRLRREQCAPLIPSVILGASYGGLGAGPSTSFHSMQDRFDLDAIAYWELRNLGAGERAARCDAQSQVQQARLRELESLDLVAREVVEAHAQVAARHGQVAVAKEGVTAALSSYRRNLDRVQGAEGLPIEALQSVQALAQARREYLRTVSDYNAAQFSLHRALGCPVHVRGAI